MWINYPGVVSKNTATFAVFNVAGSIETGEK
jgi:hypothetical protein